MQGCRESLRARTLLDQADACLCAELEAFDWRLQGWALRPDDLSVCRHEDGSEIRLGSGTYGTVRSVGFCHAVVAY